MNSFGIAKHYLLCHSYPNVVFRVSQTTENEKHIIYVKIDMEPTYAFNWAIKHISYVLMMLCF